MFKTKTLEPNQIANLDLSKIKSLTKKEIQNINHTYIRFFSIKQITWFNPNQLQMFTEMQFKNLSEEQVSVLITNKKLVNQWKKERQILLFKEIDMNFINKYFLSTHKTLFNKYLSLNNNESNNFDKEKINILESKLSKSKNVTSKLKLD